MEWKTVAVGGVTETLEVIEETFWNTGAVSVTVVDAEDNPIYEPGPGEEPVWDSVIMTGLYEDNVDLEAVREQFAGAGQAILYVETVGDRVWEREWLSRFEPMRFGERLWVCPSNHTVTEKDAVVLHLDPGLAFGTGTHATTGLCLEWLDGHLQPGDAVLDFGCGSGILGIAALLLGASGVEAIDNDPQALAASLDNATRNQVNDLLHAALPSESGEPAWAPGSFDTVVANILAQPLIDLAPVLTDSVRPGGHLVLSGIMSGQRDWVLEAYTHLSLVSDRERDGWVCLALQKPG